MTPLSSKTTTSRSKTAQQCSDDSALFGDLTNKRQQVLDELNTLTENYYDIEMPEMMSRSAKVFNTVRNYLMVDERLLLPKLDDHTSQQKSSRTLDSTRALHQTIIDTLDKLVFIHVDEPNDEYLKHLKDLKSHVEVEHDHTVKLIYPLACEQLSEHEQAEVKRQAEKKTA